MPGVYVGVLHKGLLVTLPKFNREQFVPEQLLYI